MKRTSKVCLLSIVFLFAPRFSRACSYAFVCDDTAPRMHRSFTVRVTADQTPLSGVRVEVKTFYQKAGKEDKVLFKGTTGADGSMRVPKLKSGHYILSAAYLGLPVAYDCFRVGGHSGRPQKDMSYTWGDDAPSTGEIRGVLTNGEIDVKWSVVERMTHPRIAVPISGATLSLRGPSVKEPYTTITNADGRFDFSGVPNGVYVLHVDEGKSKSGFSHEKNDQMIRVSNESKPDDLNWQLGSAICGSAEFYFPARHGL